MSFASHNRTVGSKSKREVDVEESASSISEDIAHGIRRRANPQTKEWFTNYVKGTTWMGCKMPTVREAVKEVVKKRRRDTPNSAQLLDAAVDLLQHQACDVKLAGMLLLSEHMPIADLATNSTVQRLEEDVLLQHCVDDWSSADWFAMKVLRKIVFGGNHDLVRRVLDYTAVQDTNTSNYLYVRRCGVVSFLSFEKNRDKLPYDIGRQLVDACERSLLASPNERFTQTGIAWVLRYMLLGDEEKDMTLKMIVDHGPLWTKEAKKSLTEKLGKKDPRRSQILGLT
ncbi:DNA alkylation repair enzyme [Nitzschia inconspicua]|uniref:DNA alkylation repair enzyme n=1 Tax=Nitzschia inconspicua TaxID=303405 RepID=A0A9K3KIZ5_9STRA|nr:DNA alkylation repair enzyme [Nitzschia inconspicua]